MDKETVSGLTPQQLATFPLDDFFDHYERGLKKVQHTTVYMQSEAILRLSSVLSGPNKFPGVIFCPSLPSVC